MNETLALNGGPKSVPGPLPHWPCLNEAAIEDVVATLRSGKVNYWTGERGME